MVILYVYREYGNRRKKYGSVMSNLGHNVKYLKLKNKSTPNQVNIREARKFNPDLVFMLSPFYIAYNCISPEVIEHFKNKNVPLVVYSTFNTQVPYTEWMDVWKKFDFLFLHNMACCEYLRMQGLQVHYMPLGFHPDQYFKVVKTKKIDVSFVGNAQTTVKNPEQDMRAKYLQSLKGFNICVYGKSFEKKLDGINVYSFSTHAEQRKVYARTRINLDLPFINSAHPFYRNIYHIKNRFFEIPATGNFLLTLRASEFTDILNEDMVGYYEPNIESFKETIKRYLKDESTRNKMAERAYKEVHQKHTFYHRFSEIFAILKKAL